MHRDSRIPVTHGNGAIGLTGGYVSYEVAIELTGDSGGVDALQNIPGGELGARFAVGSSEIAGWNFVLPAGSSQDIPLEFATLRIARGGVPAKRVNPESFSVSIRDDDISCFPLEIANVGTAPLFFEITEEYLNGDHLMSEDTDRVKVLAMTDIMTPSLDEVFEFLGYDVTMTNGPVVFLDALSSGDYDIFVINYSMPITMDEFWAAVSDFVANGGSVVLSNPALDEVSDFGVWDGLGITVLDELAAPSPVSWTAPTHPIFNNPYGIPFVSEPINGVAMSVDEDGALGLAYYDHFSAPNNVAMALTADEKVVINSFIFNQERYKELLINQILYVSPRKDVPWLSVAHTNGVVPVGGTRVNSVCFDPRGLEVGMHYRAFLKLITNDPEEPVMYIPVEMVSHPEVLHTAEFMLPEHRRVVRGEEFELPITVNDMTGWNVNSVNMTLKLEGSGIMFEGIRWNRASGAPAAGWEVPNIEEHSTGTFKFSNFGTRSLEGEGILAYVRLVASRSARIGEIAHLYIEPVPRVNAEAEVDNFELGETYINIGARESTWLLSLVASEDGNKDTVTVGIHPEAPTNMTPTSIAFLPRVSGHLISMLSHWMLLIPD
ncbi:MAG: hypothetical protein DRJ31_08840 [Candidatus Methanomethylicota archaeon]|uniref:Uncharacterized protein n=1 Tax=Thermoproteota archaeon TaxID=2056631 RepID=A0A497EN04_9CREN|nr:MAG: hypothetical protein DRJ31_08840 [Candidatus Verstraetearchaeota archaeon]